MKKLGKIEKVDDLRTIWPHEARDFSKWLAKDENLQQLGDAIGIPIALEERESSVGNFSVDLYATEEGSERGIIIENQLADTNHDHLGKIITYAAGKGAEIVVWIVKRARDEHKQAIAWLNQHTDENLGFFLVEVELWKIDGSNPAPRFNVVENPNEWAKTMKATGSLSETKKFKIELWQSFNDYALSKPEFCKFFSLRKARPQYWYDLSIGSSTYHLTLTMSTQKKRLGVSIYISDNKELYGKFLRKRLEIERELGGKLSWREAEKGSQIILYQDCDIRKGVEEQQKAFDWFCKTAIAMREIALRYGK